MQPRFSTTNHPKKVCTTKYVRSRASHTDVIRAWRAYIRESTLTKCIFKWNVTNPRSIYPSWWTGSNSCRIGRWRLPPWRLSSLCAVQDGYMSSCSVCQWLIPDLQRRYRSRRSRRRGTKCYRLRGVIIEPAQRKRYNLMGRTDEKTRRVYQQEGVSMLNCQRDGTHLGSMAWNDLSTLGKYHWRKGIHTLNPLPDDDDRTRPSLVKLPGAPVVDLAKKIAD